jgi:hypothetical protein
MASQELSSFASGLGVDPGVGAVAYADPDDLPVFVSRRDLHQEYLTAGVRPGDIPTPLAQVTPKTALSSQLEKEFYARDPGALADLQKRLWAGGFYSTGVDPDQIALGDYDEQTFAAWKKAVARAGAFFASGKEVTVDDVIDMAVGIGDTSGARGAGAGAGGAGRQPLSVDLTNPEDIRMVANRAAVSILGRGFRQEELERFVSSFHASQASAQGAAYGAATAGGTTVGAPSVQGAAEAYARSAAPAEAGAHTFVNVYDSFSRILARRRGAA